MRKGTRSCVECRRRKLRCSWIPDDAKTCQRCLERKISCIPQVQNPVTSASARISSKDRISRLEAKVQRLTSVVADLEVRLDGQSRLRSDASPSHHSTAQTLLGSVDEDDDEDTSDSEIVVEEPARRMNSLFQNEWLSTDSTTNIEIQHQKQKRAAVQIFDAARKALQQLVPSREDVWTLSNNVSQWLGLIAEMFPLGSLMRMQDDLNGKYDMMTQPDVDPYVLGSWLLSLSMISLQVPPHRSPSSFLDSFKKRYAFAINVCLTVDKMLLSHDSLLGTLPGLELAQLYLRVNISSGNFQKTWLFLRRLIAVSELTGLPRASKIVEMRKAANLPEKESDVKKSEIWRSICAIDRLGGVLNNYPIATKSYSIPIQDPVAGDGSIISLAYLLRLSTIAIELSDLDEQRFLQRPEAQLYASVLKLDNELNNLRASMPDGWWESTTERISPSDILRMFHCCVTVQVHLPFILRNDPSKQYVYSSTRGLEACVGVLERWMRVRRPMPHGFFLATFIDVQAFTAMAIVLLACHGARMNPNASVVNFVQIQEMENIVSQAYGLMEEKALEAVCSASAKRTVVSIKALKQILSGERTSEDGSDKITVTVPLLGTINLQRQQPRSPPNQGHTTMSSMSHSRSQPAMQPLDPLHTNFGMTGSSSFEQPWPYFIDYDAEAMFQEQLMLGGNEMFDQWQYDM